MRIATKRKCDQSMRRSKERCITPNLRRWKCTEDCKNCVCGMYQTQEGDWHHNNLIGKQPKEIQ